MRFLVLILLCGCANKQLRKERDECLENNRVVYNQLQKSAQEVVTCVNRYWEIK